MLQQYLPFTVLKHTKLNTSLSKSPVATVLTVYGIETRNWFSNRTDLFKLQQYLPFTVLKPSSGLILALNRSSKLQQYLPFTVLKRTLTVSIPPQ